EVIERLRGLAQRRLQDAEIAQRLPLVGPVAQGAFERERLLKGRESLTALADGHGGTTEVAQAEGLFGPVAGPSEQGERLTVQDERRCGPSALALQLAEIAQGDSHPPFVPQSVEDRQSLPVEIGGRIPLLQPVVI